MSKPNTLIITDGKMASALQPGDFILCRASASKGKQGATTTLGKLIQAGERTRYGNTDSARWTHTALVVSNTGDLIEAIESGVQRTNITKYAGTDYMVVQPTCSPEQRKLAVEFAEAHVGAEYGILNFVGLAVQSLFGVSFAVHMDSQLICSGLVSRATEKYVSTYPRSPEDMMPADLAHFWGAQSGEALPAPGWFGRMLDRLVTLLRVTLHL